MESTNLHQQQHPQLQDQLVGSSNSSQQDGFGVGNNDHAAWRSPNFLLNNDRNIHASDDDETTPNPMAQELSFATWPKTAINHPASHLIPNKIKQQSSTSDHQNCNSSSCFQKFSDMLSPSTSPSEMLLLQTLSPTYKNHMLNNNNHNHNHNNNSSNNGNNNNGELQLSPLFQPSMHFPNNDHLNLPSLLGADNKEMNTFSQIFPSVNISNLMRNNNNVNGLSSFDSTSNRMKMDNNLEGGLDLFATARLPSTGGSLSQLAPSNHVTELIKDSSPFSVDHHHMQQSSDLKLWNSINNFSSFNSHGVQELKRPSCTVEPKSSYHIEPKRPRFEPRASCPPLKVRKEKLGDRIAALQQLVAPFGKTDTASVLMEAIGYIKFLQDQVETLSIPYMKLSSRNKTGNTTQRVSEDEGCCERGEGKQGDLRSRGLCLVPVSCMSYLASDAPHGGVWPPPTFNPGF